MATYNGEQYLRYQLDSILNQSFKDWRLLIHDDGSVDNTLSVIKEYQEKYPEKIIHLNDGMRTGGAKNNFFHLMKNATAEYIMFCDQDDFWLTTKVQKSLDKIKDIEVNVLINNAGSGSQGRFETINADKEADLVKLNCLAPLILTHHFSSGMIENKKGAIIFLGSLVGFQPNPFITTYAASKAFNIMMGSGLWYELKKYNIDVLSISPGGTRTEFIRAGKSNSKVIVAEPEDVVKTAIKALGKKPSVVHGTINKIMVKLGRLLPLKYSTRLAGYIASSVNKIVAIK